MILMKAFNGSHFLMDLLQAHNWSMALFTDMIYVLYEISSFPIFSYLSQSRLEDSTNLLQRHSHYVTVCGIVQLQSHLIEATYLFD